MHITLVAGARPNFIKIAPIIRALDTYNEKYGRAFFHWRMVHTGQHYDDKMSDIFFRELGIPTPHSNLGVGSGSQAEQTARIMMAFEKELIENATDLVVVVGDVNSTMACAITAKKLNLKVAHVEGGLRSRDRTMPEEINRIVTDSVADYFFTTSVSAGANLICEGMLPEQIFFVGNTMIDTLAANLHKARKPALWDRHQLTARHYLLLTLHRPANVDDKTRLNRLLSEISALAAPLPIVFPVHPRTRNKINELTVPNLICSEPLGYLEFIYLMHHSAGVITDSGGVQEETTWMGIPCVTLRTTTERPETVSIGTNEVIGDDSEKLCHALQLIISGKWKKGSIPELWDGRAAERIVNILSQLTL
ncbi:MAG: UDP-N-acetylglucosamine 2-epimerase (non-hydrolyzing) [Cyclobacteriaceae bacterium]|nr:UDP-N-acetylglucosamine 2-epimerase (non-hydrolyzing) [Cyclobacteriaceae bacterium]